MSEATQSFVLFDMDGVVLEGHGTDPEVHEQALDDAIDTAGLSVGAGTRTLLAGYECDIEFIRGCDRLGIDPVEFYYHREQYSVDHAISRLDAGHRTLYPDADSIHRLDDGYSLGLVSNNYDAVTEFVVNKYDLTASEYVCGREPGVDGFYRRKPNPHYLLTGREALDGTNGIYVGDRATDVVAATRAGLDTVFVRRDHNQDVSLSITPAAEIASLTELSPML
jgi:Predicted phosphatases